MTRTEEKAAYEKRLTSAKNVVKKAYPKAFGRKVNNTYRVFSGESIAPLIASGQTAVDAWERAAIGVRYANGEID